MSWLKLSNSTGYQSYRKIYIWIPTSSPIAK